MGLSGSGIDKVRVFELPVGVWVYGEALPESRVCLVKWQSQWQDKIHHVYVNGRFAGATADVQQRQMVIATGNCSQGAVRVEVFAVEPGEADIDFGDTLERGEADNRVKLSLLRSQRLPAEARFKVYTDNGSGEVDYANPIGEGLVWPNWQDKAGFGLAGFGEGDFEYDWAGGIGFGKGNFGAGEFGVEADVIEWLSPALDAGVYRFGVKVIDGQGNESEASETGEIVVYPAARPAEGLEILSFDKETNVLALEVNGA
jgi:hypothetical protein